MANTYKLLGNVGSGSYLINYDLYTVPSSTQTIVSTIAVCNQASTAKTYRIAVRPAGATLSNEHYICYDSTVGAYDTVILTLGIGLQATDVITVQTNTPQTSILAFGAEMT